MDIVRTEEFGALRLDLLASGVGLATFSRPPVNAVSLSVYENIGDLSERVAGDPAIRVLVLTAPEEARAWCGGPT